MKKLSIKMRMTLWYAALMLLLAAHVLGFMVFISNTVAKNSARSNLTHLVEANVAEVEYDDGEIDVDDDFIYHSDGVACVVYTPNGTLADGYLPDGFEAGTPLVDGNVRNLTFGGQQYYLYDRRAAQGDGAGLWVRGIVAADGSVGLVGAVTAAACILLPFIVLAASVAGYQIARRALKPVDHIIRTAREISAGSDLSNRINLGVGTDEIHRLADTFNGMFARLEASFEEERRFTADVSHELRTPTAVILSQCEYALAHASGADEYREAVETVQRQALRMSRLVSQLLSYTRLEQGVERAVFEETNLSELVRTVCEEEAGLCAKGIRLQDEIEEDIHVRADGGMLVRLFSNLISNACQYGKEGGNIWVALRRGQNEVRLSVSDDGIGIAPESLDKIWNRFYQADDARTYREGGSMGLGLAIVEQIARLHKGRIEVQSKLGCGSTFTFVLPLPESLPS